MKRLAITLAALGGLAIPGGAQGPTDPDEFLHLQPVLREALRRVSPAIVTIETFGGTRRVLAGGGGPGVPGDAPGGRPQPQPKPKQDPEKKPDEKPGKDDGKKKLGPLIQPGFIQAQGATSGIVLSADGWILVSRFALNFDPTTILVTTADGQTYHAERKGEDTSRGVALLKIDAAGLVVPEFADPKTVAVGSWSFALGRTFGRKTPSVHMGIVSALGRQFGRAIQTDANTSPANYGGPLIDKRGRILGICVPMSMSGRDAGAELYDSGIGFAATIADIAPLLERMKTGEALHRGWLGVGTAPDFLGPGCKLTTVAKDSAAHAAGLRKGHLILAVDGVPVKNSFHLQSLISSKMGGDPAHLQVADAQGATRSITVFLKDLPAAQRQPKTMSDEVGQLPWEGEKPPDDDKR